MLIEIVIKTDITSKVDKVPPEERAWYLEKYHASKPTKKKRLYLNLEDGIRMLRMFNSAEEITFIVH
jgi:hypothetical protein